MPHHYHDPPRPAGFGRARRITEQPEYPPAPPSPAPYTPPTALTPEQLESLRGAVEALLRLAARPGAQQPYMLTDFTADKSAHRDSPHVDKLSGHAYFPPERTGRFTVAHEMGHLMPEVGRRGGSAEDKSFAVGKQVDEIMAFPAAEFGNSDMAKMHMYGNQSYATSGREQDASLWASHLLYPDSVPDFSRWVDRYANVPPETMAQWDILRKLLQDINDGKR